MTIGFSYIMIVYCLYSATWAVNGGRVPRAAYGRRLSPLSHYVPLACSRLFCQVIDRRTSRSGRQRFSHFRLRCSWQPRWLPFTAFGECRVRFVTFASEAQQACMREGFPAQPAEATIACLAAFYPWSRAAIDLGAPIVIAAVCLVLANRVALLRQATFRTSTCCAESADRQDRPSSCVLFATTRCAYVEQAGTYSHPYSISAACLPPSTN